MKKNNYNKIDKILELPKEVCSNVPKAIITGFDEIIKGYNRKQIVLFGIETHICVYQTAMDLVKNGYEVILVKDACKSRKEFEYETGIELMRQNGVKISSVEIVLFELLKTSKHTNFKEIQQLIK